MVSHLANRVEAHRREAPGKAGPRVFAHDLLEDVSGAESERWSTRVDVAPVVVCIGDVQMTSIFGTVGVGVADKRGLPLNRYSFREYRANFQAVYNDWLSHLFQAQDMQKLTWSWR